MGTVSLAVREEGRFRRVYAVKRLRPEYRYDSRVRTMFVEEARIAGLLHHPNAVSVVDVGEDDSGPYLVMDYVQGVSMCELLDESRQARELVPLQICVRIIKEVAAGLHAAHELTGHDGESLGLVHRDVSPQNILIGYDGLSRLSDFGIAKAAGRRDRTNTGILKGKVGYFSPEQLQFEKPTRQSDIFSLGIVLFELLSARRLYTADDDGDVARAILKNEPPDIDDVRSDVHPMVVELMYRMLSKDPAHRPNDAQEVVDRLEAVLSELVAEEGARPVADYLQARFEGRRDVQQRELDELTASVRLRMRPSKPPRVRRSIVGLVLVAVAAIVFGVWSLGQTDNQVASPTLAPSPDTPAVVKPPAAKAAPPEPEIAEPVAPETKDTRKVAQAPRTPARAKTDRKRTPREPSRTAPRDNGKDSSLGVMTWEGRKQ